MVEQENLKILIIGAGLGGLAAAIGCRISGHRVTVLERAPKLIEIGAGLQLSPNASRILEAYGLGPGLEECWSEPHSYAVHRYSDGKLLALSANWDVKMRERYDAPFIDVHRGQLQMLLYNRAIELGVEVLLDKSVQLVNPKTSEVTLDSGEKYTGDLVVGADGLWSVCRESLLQHQITPQPTGDLAYRICLTIDQIKDLKLREMVQNPVCRLWIGPNSHVVAYSMRGGTEFNIVLLVPDDLPSEVARQQGDAGEMRALFRDWDPILMQFLDCVDQESVAKWKLMHLLELDKWRSSQGNFILIGDSCHPMLPYLSQGAASAIEDGAVLGAILKKVESRSQVPEATQVWQALRKQRSEFLVGESLAQRTAYHMPDGPEQLERDRLFEKFYDKEPESYFPSRWMDPKIQQYIFGYNAFEEAANARLNTMAS